MNEKVTFSFGENWEDYLNSVAEDEIEEAKEDIQKWLSNEEVNDKSILDIGSGSGIHSLAFQLLGAKEILSVDYDIASVRATSYIRDNFGREQNWSVEQASILDDILLKNIKINSILFISGG